MSSLLPFIVAGLVTGSVYGLIGTGLVLTYKTSGIFNFAHGALATVAAYLFYTLHAQHGVSWPLSAAICVLGLGAGLGLLMELFARRLVLTSTAQRIAGTVGALVLRHHESRHAPRSSQPPRCSSWSPWPRCSSGRSS